AADVDNFGSLTFNANGAVAIAEDSATNLTGSNSADSLVLTSTGAVTDQANTSLTVANNANFSGTAITLGDTAADLDNFDSLTFTATGAVAIAEDSATDLAGNNTAASLVFASAGAITDHLGTSLTVTNHADLTGTAITLGDNVADVDNFGSLTFNAGGAVTIAEDSD